MKKILFTCLFLILIIVSLLYPAQIVDASKQGLLIWFEQILPALLPFTILSTLLLKSNFLQSFSANGNLLAISITMTCGFIFGFPIGAKLSSDFYKSNLLTEKQAAILSVASNNFSPMYVCGFVLPALFSMESLENVRFETLRSAAYILLYLIPLCIASILLTLDTNIHSKHNLSQAKYSDMTLQNSKTMDSSNKTHSSTFQLTMSYLDDSIMAGFKTLIKLCGYIVFFSIFVRILEILFPFTNLPFTILLANLEITNGIQLLFHKHLSQADTYIFAIQLLSLGGLSGIVQTNSIFGDSKLSIYKYIIGKVTLSLSLTLLTVIYVSYFIRF